jgi:hypothetical protein
MDYKNAGKAEAGKVERMQKWNTTSHQREVDLNASQLN